jgi:hypothetical protein
MTNNDREFLERACAAMVGETPKPKVERESPDHYESISPMQVGDEVVIVEETGLEARAEAVAASAQIVQGSCWRWAEAPHRPLFMLQKYEPTRHHWQIRSGEILGSVYYKADVEWFIREGKWTPVRRQEYDAAVLASQPPSEQPKTVSEHVWEGEKTVLFQEGVKWKMMFTDDEMKTAGFNPYMPFQVHLSQPSQVPPSAAQRGQEEGV